MKKIIIVFLIISILVLSGCVQTISKQESEEIAEQFMRDIADADFTLLDPYKEDGYWKVVVEFEDVDDVTLEINAETGEIEYLNYIENGQVQRISLEEIKEEVDWERNR